MTNLFSRRSVLGMTLGAGVVAAGRGVFAQEKSTPALDTLGTFAARSTVSLVHGENRRKNITESLTLIDDQILPKLKTKKYVVIKPNLVSTVNPLAATNLDALCGILDYLGPRFKGPVYIAESSAGNTVEAFDNFKYQKALNEFGKQKASLLDLNEEGKYQIIPIMDADLHPAPVRLASRLLDPDAFIICSAMLKAHNTVVATLSVKNMALGAPLRSSPKENPGWNDKRKYHGGVRQTHYDIMLTAQKLSQFWGLAVNDGYDGMEGNGPTAGTPVPSRIAIASTDFIAADRVGLECMGVKPEWVGYLRYCSQAGIGQYDLAKIDLRGGVPIASVRKQYRLHNDLDRELRWMGPMEDVPEKLG
jgi:uncharacterized protein (DUF362 family)